jgi:hypothetical protein
MAYTSELDRSTAGLAHARSEQRGLEETGKSGAATCAACYISRTRSDSDRDSHLEMPTPRMGNRGYRRRRPSSDGRGGAARCTTQEESPRCSGDLGDTVTGLVATLFVAQVTNLC